jgi:hypothetical protein
VPTHVTVRRIATSVKGNLAQESGSNYIGKGAIRLVLPWRQRRP